jgi:hypothetical protein
MGLMPVPRRVVETRRTNEGVDMRESDQTQSDSARSFRESSEAHSSVVGGGTLGDPRLSASSFAGANEGSRNVRRPWVWALGWVGGIVVVIAALILILR